MTALSTTETKIIRATALALIAAGFSIRVTDGEEPTTAITQDIDTILSGCGSTGESYFRVFDASGEKPARIGTVLFVHGNDEDVLADHSDSLTDIIDQVLEEQGVI